MVLTIGVVLHWKNRPVTLLKFRLINNVCRMRVKSFVWWSCDNWRSITLEEPSSYFVEVSIDQQRLQNAIEELRLVELCKVVDRYLAVPTVKCPWGCQEYLHKTQWVPLDIVFEHFFQELSVLKYSSATDRDCMRGVRADYLQTEIVF